MLFWLGVTAMPGQGRVTASSTRPLPGRRGHSGAGSAVLATAGSSAATNKRTAERSFVSLKVSRPNGFGQTVGEANERFHDRTMHLSIFQTAADCT